MKLTELQQVHYKIFVDMDGVLADFDKGVKKILDEPLDSHKYDTDPNYRTRMWKAVEKYSQQGGRLWYELPLMSDALTLWKHVKKYNPTILTAAGNPMYGAAEQKRQWIKERINRNVQVLTTKKSREKAQYAAPNHILIDDRKKSIDPWVAAGGIGILHTSAADTIKQLKELGL